MTTFLERIEPPPGDGPTLAVKDLIDLEGLLTTCASRAVAARATPAAHDAAVIVQARAAGARIVGKVNLHELAYGGTGINEAFGTPVNPLDPSLIPGGSSSGSAVAVATGEADIALGTDTLGSVRTPSACCGTVGLKTTFGLVSTQGVWPLAPSLDTVGVMARTVAGTALGFSIIHPGYEPDAACEAPTSIARLRMSDVDPEVDAAVSEALAAAELEVTTIEIEAWSVATDAAIAILLAEAAVVNRHLVEANPDLLGDDVVERVTIGSGLSADQVRAARSVATQWQQLLESVLHRFTVLTMPTLPVLAPPLEAANPRNGPHSAPINLAGVPALAMPVPTNGPIPASLQLVGARHDEATLLALGATIEAAVG